MKLIPLHGLITGLSIGLLAAAPCARASDGEACAAAWARDTAYNSAGIKVSRNDRNYTSAYWTQGNDPAMTSGPAGSGQPWVAGFLCGTKPTIPPTLPPTLPPTSSTVLTSAAFTTGIEGPAVDAANNLYVANYDHNGSIGVIASGTTTPTLFVNLPAGSISSGIRFDANDNMYATDYVNHNVFKINVATKRITVHAHNTSMNQPNDLAVMNNGILFASDPNWNNNTGNLWRINTNGTTTLLASGMGTTNGIEVSPDNKTLYVNESVQRTIWKFNVDAEGNISSKTKFKDFPDGGLDGMRTDPSGNLYVARYGKGTVVVLSPTGAVLREVSLHGVNPTNVTFNRDYTKVYVTLQDQRWVEVFSVN